MSEMDDILARLEAEATQVERIDTSFGPFYMQGISGERNWHLLKVQEDLLKRGSTRVPPAYIVAIAICNPDGSPLHEELVDTLKLISRMKRERVDELYGHALRVTGLGARALEDGEKKSSSSQSSESGTTSSASSEDAP